MPEMMPEKEAYDIARKSGVLEADIYEENEDRDEGRETLLSMRGVCSVEVS